MGILRMAQLIKLIPIMISLMRNMLTACRKILNTILTY